MRNASGRKRLDRNAALDFDKSLSPHRLFYFLRINEGSGLTILVYSLRGKANVGVRRKAWRKLT